MNGAGGWRPTRAQVWLIAGALLGICAWGVPLAYRAVMEPWSLGRESLLGAWSGSLRARQGAEYGLRLDLEYKARRIGARRGRARGGRTNLAGRAVLCTPVGQRFEYAVSGVVRRSGEIERLWLEYGDPKLSALNFQLSGAWRGGALTLLVPPRHNPFLGDGRFVTPRAVSSDDPDDSFAPATLTARDPATFETLCQRIRR
jgi:hypothetical protein